MTLRSTTALSIALSFFGLTTGWAKKIDFNRQVRPILSDKCFFCHGPDKAERKAKLRLDLRESALKNNAIVPGDVEKSEVFYRITTEDKEDLMPPEESHKHMTAEEIEIIKQWIKEGANYEGQWIYEAPRKHAPPEVAGDQVRNPIDRFIQQRLSEEARKPASEADRVMLIRRLSFDLTGLPPTPAQVRAFLSDNRPDAYAHLVEQLLASPAYGERMAAKWLDLVRYADTVGFHGDQNVSQSPFRDYVIAAFNQNMRYDQFTREQLAGDLLPNPTRQQKVASGYNRLNMTTEEGGAQPKEYLAKYAGDRVRNTTVVWMGATLGCAECHDHKYDPYTMHDFYSFAAFFADLQEVGKYGARKRPPEIPVPTAEQDKEFAQLNADVEALKEKLATDSPELIAARKHWVSRERQKLTGSNTLKPSDFFFIEDKARKGDSTREHWHYASSKDHPTYRGAFSRKQESGGLVQHILGFKNTYHPNDEDVFFSHIYIDPQNPPETVMLQIHADGNWEHRAFWGKDKIPYGGIGTKGANHHPMGALPKAGEWVRLEATAAQIGVHSKQKITAMAFTQHGGRAYWDDAGVHGVHEAKGIPGTIAQILQTDTPTEKQNAELATYYRGIAPSLDSARTDLAHKEDLIKKFNENVPTMPISVAQKPRMIRILPRGNWMDETGNEVQPAIPAFLGVLKPKNDSERLTRLDLANWIVSRDNPMTARVFVNHLWHMFFGTGISNVLSDLGNQGEPPEHPELLDWLAVEFMDSGWDIQYMIKLITQSHAYRQSSQPPTDIHEFDPYNRLVSIQSRRRLSAEMIRDNALMVSGLLNAKIGGISVHPYQPAGYYAQLNFPRRTYKHSTDENQYRRAVYSHWQRTFLHPALMAFDAPSREACTAQRPVSNTPLQALVLMNDPSFVEAAKHFAIRIQNEGGNDITTRIHWAYQEVLSRSPRDNEVKLISEVYKKHLDEYLADTDAANEILTVGLEKTETKKPAETAAWISAARILLNLHETITRF